MTTVDAPARLTRAALAERGIHATSPPVRIVHLGLGAFSRAHQAWYTASVDEDAEWGIAAFTGRSRATADLLAPQGGLYSLIVRSADRDEVEVVTSVVEVADGADVDRLVELLGAPETAIVTMTITESGYRLRPDGFPDLDDPAVQADVAALRRVLGRPGTDESAAIPSTALGRLVLGLAHRRRRGAGPIAVVPCDNMPDNGPLVHRGVVALARLVDPAHADWIDAHVSFVSTSVDRITPRTTPSDVAQVRSRTGWADETPVVTEPFHDWILSGRFPAGRPAWEKAGARFVADIEPFERRKLWLLNGAHSLLAYAGMLRGHETVAEAICDPDLRATVRAMWDEASEHLDRGQLQLDEYLPALLVRFENARIEHRLAQIAEDAVTKLRVRAVPVARAERAAGRDAAASAASIAAWIALVVRGAELADARAAEVRRAASEADPVRALVRLLDDGLADDPVFVSVVRTASLARCFWQSVAKRAEMCFDKEEADDGPPFEARRIQC